MPEVASKKRQQKHANVSSQEQKTSCPAWPSLEPLLPREDLHLHQSVRNQILTISNFWTSTLCRKYVAFLKTLPLTTTSSVPKRGEAVRVNDRFQVDDPAFAELLWTATGLRELLLGGDAATDELAQKQWGGVVVGLNSNIRVYRYKNGQYFDKHCRSVSISERDGGEEEAVHSSVRFVFSGI